MYGYLFCQRNPSCVALFESFLVSKSNKSTGFSKNLRTLYAYLNLYLYLRDKGTYRVGRRNLYNFIIVFTNKSVKIISPHPVLNVKIWFMGRLKGHMELLIWPIRDLCSKWSKHGKKPIFELSDLLRFRGWFEVCKEVGGY